MVAPHFESDICFIGPGSPARIALLDEIADYLVDSGLNIRIVGKQWEGLRSFRRLKKFLLNETAHAADAVKYYAGAKINLNLHGAPDALAHIHGKEFRARACSPSRETFEIAACGGFQLIENTRSELDRYFNIGQEVDIFSSPEELLRKIDYYISNTESREEVAHNARNRCLQEDIFRNRLEFILDKTLKRDARKLISQVVISTNGDYSYVGKKDNMHYQRVNRLIIQSVPSTAKRILDIGCGEGILGEKLKSLGARKIYGVEVSKVVAEKAKKHLDKVVIGDIEEVELPFKSNYFDCVIYSDVLEHLKDPWRVLKKQKRFLTVNGQVLAHMPNTLHYPIIKELLKGRWSYEKTGATESAYRRSFTLREIVHMFRLAGYEVEKVEGVTDHAIDHEEADAFIKRIKPLNIIPESLSFEMQFAHFLVIAKKAKHDSRQGAGLCLVKS